MFKTNLSTPSNRRIMRTLKVAILSAAVAVAATGCGGGIKPEVHKPTKLVKLTDNRQVVTPVFSASVPSESKMGAVSRFQVGFDGQQIVAAGASNLVVSYNLAGEKLWETKLDDVILGGVTFDAASRTAIVATRSANVVALDSSTGQIKWQTEVNGTVLAPALIHNNRVVVYANDGEVSGLSLTTGDKVWQFATQAPSVSVRGSAQPTLLDVNTVLVASADGRIHALDVDGGIPKWSRRVGVPKGASEVQRMTDIDAAPVVDGSNLYAVSYSGQLIGVNLNDRQVSFLKDVSSRNRLAVNDRAVFATTLDGLVQAYSRRTGELLWESDALAYRNLSNPVMFGQFLAVGDLDGVVHFLSPTDGRIVSRNTTKGAINYLQVKNGYLLTQTKSGRVAIWQMVR